MPREKILIVEDNKALSKLIVKKMEASLDFDIDSAYSYEEALRLVEKSSDYFVALLDLNLPDAPDGEVVDMVLEHQIPSIVLTGAMDKEIRESILKKNVIDYVYKGNIDDVNYIFSLIERLHKNRNVKILVVDDSMTTRSQIRNILQRFMFTVMVAAHGEEALAFLEDNPDIKLILTDYLMPVIDGIDLTKEVRKRYDKNELSIIAMTASDTEAISARFLKIGANDFIHKPFSPEEITCRINNSLDSLEYIATIQAMAQNDFLSGLSNRGYFFDVMGRYFKEAKQNETSFALGLIDIDQFKQINDSFGHSAGDCVISDIGAMIRRYFDADAFCARLGGDEFCVVLKNCDPKKALSYFLKFANEVAHHALACSLEKNIHVTISIGVALSDIESLEEMINQADQALYRAKQNGKNRVEVA